MDSLLVAHRATLMVWSQFFAKNFWKFPFEFERVGSRLVVLMYSLRIFWTLLLWKQTLTVIAVLTLRQRTQLRVSTSYTMKFRKKPQFRVSTSYTMKFRKKEQFRVSASYAMKFRREQFRVSASYAVKFRTQFRVSASYAMKFRKGEIEHYSFPFTRNSRILNCNGNFFWRIIMKFNDWWMEYIVHGKNVAFSWFVKWDKVYLHWHEVNAKATALRERFSENIRCCS